MDAVQPSTRLSPELAARFAAIVGERYAITDEAELEPYLTGQSGLYHGGTPLGLRPGFMSEVADILRLAHATRTAVVPQGGNTGLVGGQIALDGEIVLSMTRLHRIRGGAPRSHTITSEAGGGAR